MGKGKVFLVGARYKHYASRSGYESIGRYCAKQLRAPVGFRWLPGRLGWKIDKAVTAITPRPLYPLGIFLTEAATALHMLFHRGSLYHVLYGDTDVWLLARAGRMTGNLVIATFHEPAPVLEWFQIDKVAPGLDGVLLMSEVQRGYFEGLLPQERILVAPHGIDTDTFRPGVTRATEPICITVGSHWRDFETLKSAITLVRDARPDVRFVAVGANRPGGNNPRLEDDRVEFLDGLSDDALLRAYQSAKIGVFSLEQATANNALLEAMACGLPIVATDVGGVREYLRADEGILCPPKDPKAFAAGILRLLEDPGLLARLAGASRKRALAFDLNRMGQEMNRVYERFLDAGPNKAAGVKGSSHGR